MAFLTGFDSDELIVNTAAYVKSFMSQFDASHDWEHIIRVVSLSRAIFLNSSSALGGSQRPCIRKVILAGLLHDVADTKYLPPDHDGSHMIANILLSYGADRNLALEVQAICLGVSYRTEVKDDAAIRALIEKHPELAIVQDADRLDAIGAIGIGRCFTYGGAKTSRSLNESVHHFDEKLLHLEAKMKTLAGKEMARERTERLRLFQQWWNDENRAADS
ncbi:hypothetical protein QQS21_005221 [Conoideocrella luteorostrata]|uniref:HD/PDEase domain-containing protein n=1 Tax=Conoideocrella luteorostrata TaxID=1105319 RepID=A0AAJ0CQ55_9HYPO|nr:hypothetical protein QQS21_005221 [Conoideocrella luteorostrata]